LFLTVDSKELFRAKATRSDSRTLVIRLPLCLLPLVMWYYLKSHRLLLNINTSTLEMLWIFIFSLIYMYQEENVCF
jgi:hypothetical protein